jgi:hypothetical protein
MCLNNERFSKKRYDKVLVIYKAKKSDHWDSR